MGATIKANKQTSRWSRVSAQCDQTLPSSQSLFFLLPLLLLSALPSLTFSCFLLGRNLLLLAAHPVFGLLLLLQLPLPFRALLLQLLFLHIMDAT